MVYRVLWMDAAGEGRFTDQDVPSVGEAIWKTAIGTDSNIAQFLGVIAVPKAGKQRLVEPRASDQS